MWKRVLLPLAIVLGGIVTLVFMVKTRPTPKRTETKSQGALVSYVTAAAHPEKVRLPAKGTVTAAENVTLHAEVAGRVTWKNPQLVPGGRFRKGALLLRIDPREYSLALEQQKAAVDRARLEIELEQSRRAVAEREWELLEKAGAAVPRPSDPASALALRGPQLRTARTALTSAEGGLERARLSVERTTITAPFDGLVQSASVDVGQLVGPQQPLATLVGTRQYWVQVSIPVDWLVWLTGPDGNLRRSPVKVHTQMGGRPVEREGRLARLLPDVDPVGRMARVLVEIDDPLALARGKAAAPTLPLLIGSYVNVDITADELADVIELPNRALHDGDTVHVLGPGDRLKIKRVGVVYRTGEAVFVRTGLEPGEKVIVSRIATPVPGMLLRADNRAPPPGTHPPAAQGRKPEERRLQGHQGSPGAGP